MKQNIKVLLADDHAVVRQGFRLILSSQSGMTIVGEASNGREVLELAEKLQPDGWPSRCHVPVYTGAQYA